MTYILGSDHKTLTFYQIWVVFCVGSLFCIAVLVSILAQQSSSLVMEDRVGFSSMIVCAVSDRVFSSLI